jgi:two-component system NtrC family sensor kinase
LTPIKSPFPDLKRILISLIEKYHPFNIKYFKLVVFAGMTLLLGTVLILGLMSSRKVRETVTEDFNQQQLVLARHVASQIENSLETIKRELLLLSLSPSIQYSESPWMNNRLEIAFSSVKHEGVLEIRYIDNKISKTYVVSDDQKCKPEPMSPEDLHYREWAGGKENAGRILLTSVSSTTYHQASKLVMKMVLPVRQISVDEAHPAASNKLSGCLVMILDVNHLIGNITKGMRSGKTGYTWVIDENGTFLYHQEQSFIGQNAFEARKGKKSTISFTRINQIQKEKMLKGEEGTSWYTSGWHRGIEGEIKKLIAYTPIRLGERSENRIWSVAVVAPTSEVEGAIHSIHIQQFSLQAIIISVILLGGLFINFMILSWSNILEQEVAKKTAELKKSEQRYKSLVENAEDIIFTVDYDGNFLSINKYGAKFFNKYEEDLVGHNLSETFAWPSAELLHLMIQKVFDTKESRQITHMVIIGENQYWFSTNLRRLWDEEGNIYAVLGISRDITDRKQMDEHSYYTEKLASMGTLAAGVAHEINNPLAVILGFTDLLLERFPTESEEYDILKSIERQGINAKRVVENLLSFARHKEHRVEHLDVNKNIETVLSVMANTLRLNKISIKEELQHGLPLISGDAGELQQVFFNIINNAIHAMKGGGVLTITTRTLNNEKVEIRITDTGHGIKKENRKRIFDPLFTTKEVGEGTGLGLSVSYGIITKHSGSITFETKTKEESTGTGTTFIIIFPAIKQG